MVWKKEFVRDPNALGAQPKPLTSSGFLGYDPNIHRLIDRPRLPDRLKSEVAITRALNYNAGQAEGAVMEAVELLGGIERFAKKGDKVVIKSNTCHPIPANMHDNVHPKVLATVVKLLKELGCSVVVGDGSIWDFDTMECFEVTGTKAELDKVGVDDIIDLKGEPRIDIEVQDPSYFETVNIHKALVDCDVFIDVCKMKNSPLFLNFGMTLHCKSMLGLVIGEQRYPPHRGPMDMATACVDIMKVIQDKFTFALIDGIKAMEGSAHVGLICNPGVIVASHDPVASEAVGHYIAGFHPYESPTVQIMMKEDLGTGDISEMHILGSKLQDVRYPFQRYMMRYVQKYRNVKQFVGSGLCFPCLWGAMTVPLHIDPKKKYAVVAGRNVQIPKPLEGYDEVWLVGQCANLTTHQLAGYEDKIRAAKEVKRIAECPSISGLMTAKLGGVYDTPMLLGLEHIACASWPESIRTNYYAEMQARKKGKKY